MGTLINKLAKLEIMKIQEKIAKKQDTLDKPLFGVTYELEAL